MAEYRAPIGDMRFVMRELAGLPALSALPTFESASADVVDTVLEEAGRFASQVLSPLNRAGDLEGSRIVDGEVRAAKGFGEAYRQFAAGGWIGLAAPADAGGQALPFLLHAATSEMWAAANTSFANCPELTGGAIVALAAHAEPRLRERFLPKLVSGEWAATMCLTEPQAGSDLAAVQTRAERVGDACRLFGRKIFITWGDHDMTENICHLVLARAPGAPPGVKGISLFLVPKYRVNPDGSLGERNDIRPVSVEHKLGMHASPTCVLAIGDQGGAEGFLVGGLHEGLACMFTMMNHMRISVGLQGIGLADRARQQAAAYARERVQGRTPDGRERARIVQHADVRRMLLTQRALVEAGRAVAYVAAGHLDLAKHARDDAERRYHQSRVDLLTPIVKGWGTELAQESAALAMQVHGGTGFIEETGVAQIVRDARITTIYEGTNGIQALDLVGRKLLRDGGRSFQALIADVRATATAVDDPALGSIRAALSEGADALEAGARLILEKSAKDPQFALATAFHFLMLAGIVCGGWQMTRAAVIAQRRLAEGGPDAAFHRAKVLTARVFAEQVMPRAAMHAAALRAGSEAIMDFDEDVL